MRASFDRRIDVALDDLRLQNTLAATTFRFVELRDRAAHGLPEWEQLREQANAIKRHTIEKLSHYLQQLEARVLDRGGHVFWAADGEQACAYITELARARHVRLVVKSKSMLSEEIELNHALERQGIEAVETDLGEYIIQLAGEKPSHIIAPAIHKTRKEVADLFEQKLGLPRTEEIPKLTAAARSRLREKFLTAGMGVTGANFAVAETGSLVLVENEGNIRFCSSVPRLHVAVMGIEKVIPRMADLAVFLRLIARSGTGQKLTSYVSVLSGARRASEPDGPAEFHLVLLDNGRTRALGDPLLREALYCIRCGACLNVCPVYRKIGGHAYPGVYSGPIGAVLTPQILGLASEPKLPYASSLCGACRDVCPVKIRIPELLLALREQETESAAEHHRLEKLAFRVWAWVMERPWLYEWAGRGARFAPLPLGPAAAWKKTRELPTPPESSFREWWRKRRT